MFATINYKDAYYSWTLRRHFCIFAYLYICIFVDLVQVEDDSVGRGKVGVCVNQLAIAEISVHHLILFIFLSLVFSSLDR